MRYSAKNLGRAALVLAAATLGMSQGASAQQEIKLGYALATTSHYGVAANK